MLSTKDNRIRLLALLMIAAATQAHAQTQMPAEKLSSAAIDPTIYRDGEVRRSASVHGHWHIVCDEVTRLRQRFCSLRSVITAPDGAAIAELTISTGQDGRPAGLLKSAAPLVSGGRIEITVLVAPAQAAPTAKGKAKSAAASPAVTNLKPVGCDAQVCTFIWTLRAEQIAALNDGRGLNLLTIAGPDNDSLASFAPVKPRTMALKIAGDGFKEAVAVSVRPFE